MALPIESWLKVWDLIYAVIFLFLVPRSFELLRLRVSALHIERVVLHVLLLSVEASIEETELGRWLGNSQEVSALQ